MKRVIALSLTCCLLLSACGQPADSEAASDLKPASVPESTSTAETVSNVETVPPADGPAVSPDNIPTSDEPAPTETASEVPTDFQSVTPEFHNLSDPALLNYMEDSVYQELISNLDDDYFVQNLSTVYVSQEYLEELSYNSQENIFFGYTLAELDEQFQGTRYVFTLDEGGKTTVEPFEEYDRTYEKAIKNVAIGTGVILICVTVSAVSGGVGAPAINMIFAASAKTGTIMALSSGGIGAVMSGVITGVQTQNFDDAVKAAALAGSEGFKWGAISGAVSGGFSETMWLTKATKGGLTMSEAAIIQKESKYPLAIIKNLHSMKEYNVYKEANLQFVRQLGPNGGLVQRIDWDFIGDDGRTNAKRVLDGLSPLDSTGQPYELHHINQQADSPLAILTNAQHHGNYAIIHENTGLTPSNIDRNLFAKEKREFWEALLNLTWKGA